jgi:hypothetical protein
VASACIDAYLERQFSLASPAHPVAMVLRPQTDEVPLRRSRRNLELLAWGSKVAHDRDRRFDYL